ncbi:hypothetical protein KOY48_02785 [Candidatus Minimicrobia naudis]|uniref:Uncharacterized protein n=1 Tax=Candidatus Minimicrobia naudis TaxID=2841263 RepID=A0A8F1MC25_9BACT|nr:hypothetical protein KOY48_02785 [Candidatus Minimicrobia naudis]
MMIFPRPVATFLIESLHPGYCHSLGNLFCDAFYCQAFGVAQLWLSGLRVRLSDFITVEGVKEDVVDIMLNLKNVHLRVFTDDSVELRL